METMFVTNGCPGVFNAASRLGGNRRGSMRNARRHSGLSVHMAAKQVVFHEESRRRLVRGINAVADAVRITLGPRGRNVVLERSYGAPEVVNDGVTIARDISLEDPTENVGARLLQEVASKTDQRAGDGTTTSTVLAQSIINQGLKLVESGANPIALKRGLDKAGQLLRTQIRELAVPIKSPKDIESIATIASGNSEEFGRIIAQAFERVGENGSTVVEESQTITDDVEFSEGMEIDRGYVSPYFVKEQDRQTCTLEKPRILITDMKIANVNEIIPILEQCVKDKEPLLIIADDVTGEALSTLVVNKMRGVLDVCAIKAPGFGDRRKAYLQDIAVVTGASVIASELGMTLENVADADFGRAERVVVGKETTTIISDGSHETEVKERVKQIRKEREDADTQFDREKCDERIARLSGGVARIRVGAATESELKDKKLRYEDAINSCRAALEEGVVPGGGATLVYMMQKIDEIKSKVGGDEDMQLGVELLRRSLKAPLVQIAENCGLEGEVVLGNVVGKPFGYGYNAATGEYGDMIEMGILDPVKVTNSAIENAISVAGLVLTTEALVVEIPEKKDDKKAADDGMDDLPGESYY